MSKIVQQPGTIEGHLTKEDIQDLARTNANQIIDARKYDLLRVYIELKRYETYLKELIGQLKDPALSKASEQGKKAFSYDQAKVQIFNRTKWDYTVDEKWTDLDAEIKHLTKLRKERETFLKTQSEKGRLIDEETGEVIEDFELPKEIGFGLQVKL